MPKLINSVQLIAIIVFLSSCQTDKPVKEVSSLGILNHQFSISDKASSSFEKGLLLLHSFEYDDAREAFQEAIVQDSTELMAYWGEAMSHYKALWGLQDVEAGRTVMNQIGPDKDKRMALAEDELEKGFWRGVEILYGEGTLPERNKAYAKHMAGFYDRYPKNQEVAAFYALGLMWSVEGGRDAEVFDLSAKVVSGILDENPNHPGALHYLIHANDDPDYAQFSKIAANKYAKVAPDATHALHMPSHIYLALGMWNDVVSSNEASYSASVARMERKGLDDGARGYHSYAWLHYGYLQQGRVDKAEQLLKDMQTYTGNKETRGAKSYLIAMQSAQIVESGKWPETLSPMYVDYNNLGLSSKARQHFLKAQFAFVDGDTKTIQNQIDTVQIKIQAAEFVVSEGAISICSAGPTRYAPRQSDIDRANVMVNQMQAMIAMLSEDDTLAEKHLRKATETETLTEYSYGPPDIIYPSFEQYGEWLLAKNRADDAIVQFDKSLATAKNRAKALKGKQRALNMLGRSQEAEDIQVILNEFQLVEISV